MTKTNLAIFGGEPIRKKKFPSYSVIGKEEKQAVLEVLDSGKLSGYLGCWDEDFMGGRQVRSLEEEWSEHFRSKHALCVNSATSGLIAAVGACDIGPGDEVIVSPYTMTASASCVLFYGAVPVFADVEADYFCIDPKCIEEKITPRTKAIIIVDLFGQPYDATRVNAIAAENGLKIIEDAAQAPNAKFKNKFTGLLGDVGVHSLNVHKHIHTGEGGIVLTDNDYIAKKISLIRNHAEAVVEDMGFTNLTNMVGMNLRMTEVEAAMARCQLRKLESLVEQRRYNFNYLASKIESLPGLEVGKVRPDSVHANYVFVALYKQQILEVHRDRFIEAIRAELPETEGREGEGAIFSCGYVKPLYLQPLYQSRIAIGKSGYPFKHIDSKKNNSEIDYSLGICPVTESLWKDELFFHEIFRPPMTETDLDSVYNAFEKVYENRQLLK